MSIKNPEMQHKIDNWMNDVAIRLVRRRDLKELEWEGEYIRYRNIYLEVFKRMRRGTAQMWVADLGGNKLIGQVFIQFYLLDRFKPKGEKQAYIHAVRVRQNFRDAGIGTMLMQHAERTLIEKGTFEVTLNVAKENLGALRLYKNLGYHIVGETSGRWWYHDHENKLQEVLEPSWRLIKQLK
jgi:ribosomal protein S18 acetylase RimI-like enzyme